MKYSTCFFAMPFNRNWVAILIYCISFVINSTKIKLENCTASQIADSHKGFPMVVYFLYFNTTRASCRSRDSLNFHHPLWEHQGCEVCLEASGGLFEHFYSQLTNVHMSLVTYFFPYSMKHKLMRAFNQYFWSNGDNHRVSSNFRNSWKIKNIWKIRQT